MTCMPNYSNSFQFDNINHDNNVFELKLLKTNSCSDLNVVAQKKVQNIWDKTIHMLKVESINPSNLFK